MQPKRVSGAATTRDSHTHTHTHADTNAHAQTRRRNQESRESRAGRICGRVSVYSLIEMMMVDFQSTSYNISLKTQLNTRKVIPIQATSLVNDIEGTSSENFFFAFIYQSLYYRPLMIIMFTHARTQTCFWVILPTSISMKS